jgi:biotin transporter BioY
LWLGISLKLSFSKALVVGIGWYLPLDIIKIFIASFIAYYVREALIKCGFLRKRGFSA